MAKRMDSLDCKPTIAIVRTLYFFSVILVKVILVKMDLELRYFAHYNNIYKYIFYSVSFFVFPKLILTND